MVNKAEERAMHPVQPFKHLIIKTRDGALRVNALGTSNLYPAIDMSYTSSYPSGRLHTAYIALTSDNFQEFFQYLQEALKHWQPEGG